LKLTSTTCSTHQYNMFNSMPAHINSPVQHVQLNARIQAQLQPQFQVPASNTSHQFEVPASNTSVPGTCLQHIPKTTPTPTPTHPPTHTCKRSCDQLPCLCLHVCVFVGWGGVGWYAHAHASTPAHTHTLLHVHTHTLLHMHTHTLLHMHTHTLLHLHTHTLLHPPARPPLLPAHPPARPLAGLARASTHTHTHRHTHTLETHTNTHRMIMTRTWSKR